MMVITIFIYMSNSLQNQFENLLETEVDHREFPAYAGAALLGVLGISGLIKSLTQSTPNQKQSASGGYGSSTYGGTR